jgi:hypothetical protein
MAALVTRVRQGDLVDLLFVMAAPDLALLGEEDAAAQGVQ